MMLKPFEYSSIEYAKVAYLITDTEVLFTKPSIQL